MNRFIPGTLFFLSMMIILVGCGDNTSKTVTKNQKTTQGQVQVNTKAEPTPAVKTPTPTVKPTQTPISTPTPRTVTETTPTPVPKPTVKPTPTQTPATTPSTKSKITEGIIPAVKNGKWGYVDKSGKTVVDYQFDQAWGVFNNVYCVVLKNDIIYKQYPDGTDLERTFVDEDIRKYAVKKYNVDTSKYLADIDAWTKLINEFSDNAKKYVNPYEDKLKSADPEEYKVYDYYKQRAYDLNLKKIKASIKEMDIHIQYWEQKKKTWPGTFRY